MGLFDRFKKRVEETEKAEGITAAENSPEAMEALEIRQRLQEKIPIKKNIETIDDSHIIDNWEEYDSELHDPFAKPTSPKDRKLKNRLKSKSSEKNTEKSTNNRLATTAGKKLIKLENKAIKIDLTEDQVSRRGRIIKESKLLDEILEELETDLLSVDMGHTVVSELIELLHANLVGTRVPRKAKLGEIVERAVHRTLSYLLESEYWDFDKTIQSLILDEGPISIMIVGVNGTGKTTSTAKSLRD